MEICGLKNTIQAHFTEKCHFWCIILLLYETRSSRGWTFGSQPNKLNHVTRNIFVTPKDVCKCYGLQTPNRKLQFSSMLCRSAKHWSTSSPAPLSQALMSAHCKRLGAHFTSPCSLYFFRWVCLLDHCSKVASYLELPSWSHETTRQSIRCLTRVNSI